MGDNTALAERIIRIANDAKLQGRLGDTEHRNFDRGFLSHIIQPFQGSTFNTFNIMI